MSYLKIVTMITTPDYSMLIMTITATDIFFSGESGLIMLVIITHSICNFPRWEYYI